MITTIDGLKTYYEAAGERQPVLLLHGWGTDSSSMRSVLKLVRDGLPGRAIAPDFPGFGFSDHPTEAWDVSRYEAFVLKFIDMLELPQVAIVAHSFGGRVAIKFAAHHPDRLSCLVLVDSAGILPKRDFGWHLRVGLAKTVKKVNQQAPGASKALGLDKVAARQGSEDYRNAGDMRATFVKVVNEDLRQLLPSIHCPTLLVWGEKDDATPVADGDLMQHWIPGSRLEVLRGVGHFSYAEAFPEFSQLLIPFLKRHM
jgi:pimeloyl-ACP methyl ester carboxylesterase